MKLLRILAHLIVTVYTIVSLIIVFFYAYLVDVEPDNHRHEFMFFYVIVSLILVLACYAYYLQQLRLNKHGINDKDNDK